MSTKLTRVMKSQIISTILRTAFKKERDALIAEGKVIAERVYRTYVTENEEKQIRALPKNFFEWRDKFTWVTYGSGEKSNQCLYLKWNEQFGREEIGDFNMPDGRDFPITMNLRHHKNDRNRDKALYGDIEKHNNAVQAIEGKIQELRAATERLLNGCATVKRLREVAPDLAEMLPETPEKNLPTVLNSKDVIGALFGAGVLPVVVIPAGTANVTAVA